MAAARGGLCRWLDATKVLRVVKLLNHTTLSDPPTPSASSPKHQKVTAAKLADQFPSSAPALETLLLPGAWFRESFAPFLRCRIGTSGGACEREQRVMFDVARLRRRVQLPALTKLIGSKDFAKGGGELLLYGCMLVTLSAVFAAVFTVRTALVGFALVAVGVWQAGHEPLPPGLLVAFLCVYSGFNLGEGRRPLRLTQRAGSRRVAAGGGGAAAAAAGAGGSGSAAAASKSAAKAKATPAKVRRA